MRRARYKRFRGVAESIAPRNPIVSQMPITDHTHWVRIASALIADQALPNANHRTTLMYVGIVLNICDAPISRGLAVSRSARTVSMRSGICNG